MSIGFQFNPPYFKFAMHPIDPSQIQSLGVKCLANHFFLFVHYFDYFLIKNLYRIMTS